MLVIRRSERTDVYSCVRVARDAHEPVYSSMRAIYGDDLFERLRPDWAEVLGGASRSLGERARRWSFGVADLDGVTVGFIVTSCDLQTGMGMVELVAVDRAHQRQGVGGRLVAQALAQLREVGVAYVEAYVRDFAGHEPAHRLFRSKGFARRAVMPVLLYRTIDQPGDLRHLGFCTIRRLAPADVEESVTFGVDAFRSVYASFETLYGQDLFERIEPDWEASQASYIRTAITDSDDETWVYDLDGRPAGFVVLKMDDARHRGHRPARG